METVTGMDKEDRDVIVPYGKRRRVCADALAIGLGFHRHLSDADLLSILRAACPKAHMPDRQ